VDYGNTLVMESGMSGAPVLPASGMLHVQVAEDFTLDVNVNKSPASRAVVGSGEKNPARPMLGDADFR